MNDKSVFVAVLAAGASRRFGTADKLAAPFRGKRLGQHVCDNAPSDLIAPAHAYVIASEPGHPCEVAWRKAGFGVAINKHADEGMGTSVALAATLALKVKCDALLIALADMPFVPGEHFAGLVHACTGHDAIVCSSDGRSCMPPAVFGKGQIAPLTTLAGDQGARAFLKQAQVLACPAQWLIDIDTPETLASLS